MITEEIIKNLGEEEWENFQPADALSPDKSGKLWDSINKNTKPRSVRVVRIRWAAAAASIVLVAGGSWLFMFKGQKAASVSVATPAITKSISNTTPQQKKLTLSDGSSVELLPSSALSYPENFNSLKREVILNGEATFDIAKDGGKPFSVYSNPVLITVLGTRFTVKTYESLKTTKVILQEGKVMVKITDSTYRKGKEEYYLNPGDVFLFKGGSNDTLSARILHLEKDKEDDYVFNNYPLDVVFDQLAIIYKTRIIYNKEELGNRTFIGKIDKKDPLYHTLQSIVLLNHFDLHKQGDSLVIGK